MISAVTITAVFSIAFALLRFKGQEKASFVFKFLSSAGFIAIAVTGYLFNSSNGRYFFWLIMALGFGFLGDIALGLKNIIDNYKKYLIASGIIFFLLGHIMYSVNYITQGGVPWWLFVINIGVAALMMQGTRRLNYKLSFFYIVLGHIYCYTITMMLISAISYYFSFQTLAATLVLIGGISFFVSDSLLSMSYFKPDAPNTRVLNLIVHFTYYPAQILLALSVFFI
ncbi:MAG: lysoplasmalogenase [Christensenellales bacterium]|jgi:hypothetical protein